MLPHNFQYQIASRIQQARKKLGFTQEFVSEHMGFKDRQILSNIESGSRKISADELVNFMDILQQPLEYFTDPYVLTEPEAFSWRAACESSELEQFQTRTGKLVMAYRRFSDLLGEAPLPVLPRLTLSRHSSYKEALFRAEQFIEKYDLGDIPATRLENIIRDKLNIVVLHVDAPTDLSGAACHLHDLSIILINRNNPAARRHYDLAHELFHLLTWDAMPPETIDPIRDASKKMSHVERLAENFAAGLLMPEKSLENFWKRPLSNELHERIMAAARHFLVSGTAIYWRLINLGLLGNENVSLDRLKGAFVGEKPQLFCTHFVNKLYQVLDKGLVSVRKAADLLDMTIEDLASLLRDYSKDVPFDL